MTEAEAETLAVAWIGGASAELRRAGRWFFRPYPNLPAYDGRLPAIRCRTADAPFPDSPPACPPTVAAARRIRSAPR